MIQRFALLDIATTDLVDAISAYERNFDFTVRQTDDANEAIIELADAKIRLRTGASVADVISSSGEGLAAIWLETQDVQQIAEKLRAANIAMSPIRIEGGLRVLAVNPRSADMAPLFIFERL